MFHRENILLQKTTAPVLNFNNKFMHAKKKAQNKDLSIFFLKVRKKNKLNTLNVDYKLLVRIRAKINASIEVGTLKTKSFDKNLQKQFKKQKNNSIKNL